MKSRSGLFLLLFACIAIGAVALITRKKREPTYNGRPLSEWLDQRDSGIFQDERTHAVQQIGTNALPFLLKWIQSPPSALETNLSRLLSRFHGDAVDFKLTRPETAVAGFAALRERAKSAIPALVLLAESTNTVIQESAFEALGCIGKDALPVLVDIATNSAAHTRCDRLGVGVAFWGLDTNALPAKPALLAHIGDPDVQVANASIFALAQLVAINSHTPPDTTADIVPALCANPATTNKQVLLRTIRSLFFARSSARPAVPFLLQNLTSTNQEIRAAAGAALSKIDPQALARAQKQ